MDQLIIKANAKTKSELRKPLMINANNFEKIQRIAEETGYSKEDSRQDISNPEPPFIESIEVPFLFFVYCGSVLFELIPFEPRIEFRIKEAKDS